MGPNSSENFKMILLLQIAAKSFQTCPESSFQRSSQKYIGDFWNFEFPIFKHCFRKFQINHYSLWKKNSIIWKTSDLKAKRSEIWDSRVIVPHMWDTFGLYAFKVILTSFGALVIFPKMRQKTTSSTNRAKIYQTSPKLSCQGSSQNYVWDFWKNCENWNFNIFFIFFFNMGPHGSENYKKLLPPYKSQPTVFKLVLNFPAIGPHKTTLGTFEILSFWFLTIFFCRKFEIHHCTLWRNQ